MSGISAVILAFTALSTASAFSVVGPTLVLRSPTDVSAMSRSCKALGRVQMCTPQETTERRSVDLPGGNSPSPPLNELNPLTRTDKSWSERTTILDREQRINNDPLAPRKPRTFVPYEGQTMGGQKRADVEREGYEWYKSMEDQVCCILPSFRHSECFSSCGRQTETIPAISRLL